VCIKTKAKKSLTITVTLAIILFSCNAWDEYKVRYKDSIRSVEIENVERLRKCRTPKNGYKTYKCPECGTIKYVTFTCKFRYVIFTIPDTLREVFRNPEYQKILFAASKITMEEMIKSSNKKSKKKIKLKIGILDTYILSAI